MRFRLISWFWYLFVPTSFYFLLVVPAVVVLMLMFVIFIAYTKNPVSKVFNGPAIEFWLVKFISIGKKAQ